MNTPMCHQYGFRYIDLREQVFKRGDRRQTTIKMVHFPSGAVAEVSGEVDVSTRKVRKMTYQKLKREVQRLAKEAK